MGNRILTVALTLGLLGVNALGQPRINQFRARAKQGGEEYGPSFNWLTNFAKINELRRDKDAKGKAGLSMESVSMVVVLGIVGGFRSVAADVLWLKSDEWWHKGQADRMIPLLKLVTWLDPNFIDGWKIAGWHWAYNLRVQAPTPEGKEQCMRKGLNFLEEGVAWNPDRHEVYFELGWTYADKVGDMQKAAEWYERALPLALLQGLKRGEKEKAADGGAEAKSLIPTIEPYGETAQDLTRDGLARLYQMDKAAYARAFKLLLKKPMWTRAPSPEVCQRMQAHSVERMPDFPQALVSYNVLLDMTAAERERLDQFVALAHRADMDIDEFQQAIEAIKSKNARDSDPKQKRIKRHPEVIAEGLRLFELIPELRQRDTVASGATLTITARYLPTDRLLRAGKFAEARESLLKLYTRFFKFQEGAMVKKSLDAATRDAFVACERNDYATAQQLIKVAYDKEGKNATAREKDPLEAALKAFESKDYEHATRILEGHTVRDTLFEHQLARIYEQWADSLNQAGQSEEAKKLWRRAFDTWVSTANNNASDHLAAARVRALAGTVGANFQIREMESNYNLDAIRRGASGRPR